DIIKALPATRSYGALLTAIPGLMVDNTVNNGAMTTPFMTFFSANGGRSNEGRMMVDGLNVAAPFSGGGVSTFIYDVANTEEMQVSVSGSLGEAENGGPQGNLVPKSGGNTFNGSFFYQGAGGWSSGDNLNDTLRKPVAEGGSGLTAPAKVISSWDANGSGCGPSHRATSSVSLRPHQARQVVVLRQPAQVLPVAPGARRLRQPQRGRRVEVAVRERSEHRGA